MGRTPRFTILLHLPDGHDAEHVQDAIIRKMRTLPTLARLADMGPGLQTGPAPQDRRDAVAAEPDDRHRQTLDHMKPSEKILGLTNDTATTASTGTMDTNRQQRRCEHH